MGWGYWPKYVSVAKRRARAKKIAEKLKKGGSALHPVEIEGRQIAKTFWGKAWCENLENYSDYENRLPRGRTYVRNGFVIDLDIAHGQIKALVHGSDLYHVQIDIKPLEKAKWETIVKKCAGKIDSLIELLQGKFSKGVMEIVTHPENGLFPKPKEIKLSCSCPDGACMCKHIAAALYGVAARFDMEPEALFILRKVDHTMLINASESVAALIGDGAGEEEGLQTSSLSELFGIDLDDSAMPQKRTKAKATTITKKIAKIKSKPKAKTKSTTTKIKKTLPPKKRMGSKRIIKK
jgi:uncharacterized Zn finger protein